MECRRFGQGIHIPNVRRVNASIGFNTDKVGIAFSGNYIGRSRLDDQFIASINEGRARFDIGPPIPLDSDLLVVDDEFYFDAQVRFTPVRTYEMFVGVDNLLDNKAPHIPTGIPSNVTGADTAADVYDVFGRRYYAGVRLRF